MMAQNCGITMMEKEVVAPFRLHQDWPLGQGVTAGAACAALPHLSFILYQPALGAEIPLLFSPNTACSSSRALRGPRSSIEGPILPPIGGHR